ncbi:MAG: CBS domain-containing protein [Acidobacteriota bacterium]
MRPITAADLMNPEVLTVRADMTVQALAAYLIDNAISGAPVAGQDGSLVGVVSVVDIAKAASREIHVLGGRPDFYVQAWPEDTDPRSVLPTEDIGRDLLVRDVMTPDPLSVSEDTRVSDIAELMLREHVHRLLVTRGTHVVGILSTSDLLGLLVDVDEGDD